MQSLPIWPKLSAHSLIIALVITWVINRQVGGLLACLRVDFFVDHCAARASFYNPDQYAIQSGEKINHVTHT